MKLIRKQIFVFVLIISIIFTNSKSRSKKSHKAKEEKVDSDLIFIEKLYTLDTSIKNELKNKENVENSGFEEFDNPVNRVNTYEDSINSNQHDQENLKDELEDKFSVGNNSNEDLMDVERDNFENTSYEINQEENKFDQEQELELEEENNFMELGDKTNTNSSTEAEFFKNKLDEINKFEEFLLDQEKQLEEKSRELLERTKSFMK